MLNTSPTRIKLISLLLLFDQLTNHRNGTLYL
jgi:hypothetical protein